MDESPQVLVTNDDGIDATGIREVAAALTEVAAVTIVAPSEDRSGISRAGSSTFDVESREMGYAVDGTPTDCVQFGLGWLEAEFDLVVSGCNDGPNLGAHRLSRSGTVAAAIEAGFEGVTGIALSVFDPPEGVREFYPEDYQEAGRVAKFLVEAIHNGDPEFDYLNVNVPATADSPTMRLTNPVEHCEVSIEQRDDGSYYVWDHFWDPLRPDVDRSVTDPVGTDRRAVAEEEISVTPLRVGQQVCETSELESVANRFNTG